MKVRPLIARPSVGSAAPGLTTGGKPELDLPEDPPDRLELQPEPEPAKGVVKKCGLGALAALTLAGGLVGLGATAARTLPVCQQTSSTVAVENNLPCVSADLSTRVDGLFRVARGRLHRARAIEDLAWSSNRILQPKQPRKLEPDGRLRVVSWNLHHGASPNGDGARDQMHTIVDTMRQQSADVFLLQEVAPWQAQELTDATGMVGYYSQTTPRQGNMILVEPGLEVSSNRRQTLNHQIAVGDHDAAAKVVNTTGGLEPRAAQSLRVEGGDAQGAVTLFNTHLSTGSATPQARQREGLALMGFVEDSRQPAEMVVGGGDLNVRSDGEVVEHFRDEGYLVEGATIDWLVSKNSDAFQVESFDITTSSGARVSDHPLVRADV